MRLLCACDGKLCKGECRERNLNRKRKPRKDGKNWICPAAYEKK